ncbi:hypothetical protein RB594_002443 [Gaeumannomyces avenae]
MSCGPSVLLQVSGPRDSLPPSPPTKERKQAKHHRHHPKPSCLNRLLFASISPQKPIYTPARIRNHKLLLLLDENDRPTSRRPVTPAQNTMSTAAAAPQNVLAARDVNAPMATVDASTADKPNLKSMDYHRQVLASKMEEEKTNQYISPSDNIMSPCSAKLNAYRNKQVGNPSSPRPRLRS